MRYIDSVWLLRYDDLIAQGVNLQQATMPPSSSFSHMSNSDLAPGTPQRSPAQPPSPRHLASDESMIAAQQAQASDSGAKASDGQPGQTEMNQDRDSAGHGIQSAIDHPQTASQESEDQRNESENMPLLANSAGALLTDKLADPAQLLSQNVMLRNHRTEASKTEIAGLSKGALQTGFRAAGKVSMAEGMSEPVTEAIEALSPVGNGPDEDVADSKLDNKGRIMKVLNRAQTGTHVQQWVL